MTTPAARDLDVVVFGATGFVGKLLAAHLAEHAPEGVTVGLAGRSAERLEQVRSGLAPRAADWPLLVADVQDVPSLTAMATRARVVATTVGPYARYGLPLVEACATAGTDYADLTGEVLFMRQSIDRFHETAAASGARIVHACGFDSIPSDLGVLLAAEQARTDGEGELTETVLHVVSMKGGVSGGTIDSARTQLDEAAKDPQLQRIVEDPYSLSPDRAAEPDLGDERDNVLPGRDPLLGRWTGPFVMAAANTRVVRRSNALSGWSYGRAFRYREVMGFGTSPLAPVLATGMSIGLAAGMAGMAFGPTRAVLDRLLPAPGQGPGEEARRNGHFRIEVVSRTTTGARYTTTFAAKGDPGYAATAVMQGESALCLALDRDRLPQAAGVLTPATAMGAVLAERLRAQGFEISVARGA
ncbi:MAG: enoyl-ACP reductase [Frankiales bacterium]|jgi:short subunit dehydrogenase-like uncharacterized protein|nr:enoyl-ACP reductase [Frankiales bacterium]